MDEIEGFAVAQHPDHGSQVEGDVFDAFAEEREFSAGEVRDFDDLPSTAKVLLLSFADGATGEDAHLKALFEQALAQFPNMGLDTTFKGVGQAFGNDQYAHSAKQIKMWAELRGSGLGLKGLRDF